jgi:mRNA interferase RelE/StbE
MTGEGPYYRIRIGEYRLGIAAEDDEATLLRFLHRSEIYQFFP